MLAVEPLALELVTHSVCERAILEDAAPPLLQQRSREDQQWRGEESEDDQCQSERGVLERQRGGALVHDAVRQCARNNHAEPERRQRERAQRMPHEFQAGSVIRMTGQQPQIEPRHHPEKADPHDETPGPAEQQDEKERQADQRVPPSGWRVNAEISAVWQVPRGKLARRQRLHQDQGKGICTDDHRGFRHVRIAQPTRRGKRCVERGAIRIADQTGLEEMPCKPTESRDAERLDDDQRRQRNQVARMDSEVDQE